jgi:Fe2+ or Zn2+ uptake regulation protein
MVLRLRRPDLASQMRTKLREAGLRPTRTRIALSSLLFARGDRHISAEMLFEEAKQVNVPVSLATVYNTLNQFTDAGLLRQVAIDGSRSYFDTNIPSTIIFISRKGMSSSTPRLWSARLLAHQMAMRSFESMSWSACGERRLIGKREAHRFARASRRNRATFLIRGYAVARLLPGRRSHMQNQIAAQ